MIWPLNKRVKKPTAQTSQLSGRAYDAMAVMLLLALLPHIFHLPIWLSLIGIGIVLLKWHSIRKNGQIKLSWLLSSRVAVIGAVASAILIRAHYGYFFGRDPCVAFLMILVACKFAETRKQSDATTLMCLSGFLLLTQYFYSQSILSAFLTVPAVISIGVALSILNEHKQRATGKHIRLVGRLLLQGLPIAALLFVVFPRLPGPLWSLPEDGHAVTGLGDSMSPGEISKLSRSGAVAFRVDFDGTPPDSADLYWRGPVMSNFDGRNWTINQLQDDGAVEPDNPGQSISYTVTLQPHNKTWLFALEQASSLPQSGITDASRISLSPKIRSDKQLISSKQITRITQYKQTSLLRDRYKPLRRPSAIDTQLPGKNKKTIAFAKELFRKHSTPQSYTRAVLEWFNTQDYSYTLEPKLLGDTPIDEFLFDSKSGFCSHYATAFVTMMRANGIPARVVTGYQGGEMNGDYMIVRQSEAHAWTEVFMDGHWVRFDPTAAVAPSRVSQGLAESLPEGEPVPRLAQAGNGWLKRASLRMDKINHAWQRMVVDFDNESQTSFWKKLGMPDPQLWQITGLLLLLAGVWCLWVLRPSRSTQAPLSDDERLWRNYCKLLETAGVNRHAGETGPRLSIRARAHLPEHDDLIARMALTFSKLRFEPITDTRKDVIRAQLKRDMKKLAVVARKTKRKNAAKQNAQTNIEATSG